MESRTRYVFITGGVVSSLGKGVTAASLGRLLKCRGLKVAVVKLDPYINVDPGTMSPFQHGEVFVTEDGAETDLDLGHYERFIDEIKRRILRVSEAADVDIVLVEIGGTVGDIESLPFLEAIRQLRNQVGRDHVVYVHVTLVPMIEAAGELKTKPTQHSVYELRRIGITPDVVVCRSSRPLDRDPRALREQRLDDLVAGRLGLDAHEPDLAEWCDLADRVDALDGPVRIAIVGK